MVNTSLKLILKVCQLQPAVDYFKARTIWQKVECGLLISSYPAYITQLIVSYCLGSIKHYNA